MEISLVLSELESAAVHNKKKIMALLKHLQKRTFVMNDILYNASLYVYMRLDLNKHTGLERYFQMSLF